MRKRLFTYIKKKYKVEPEYPWSRYDTNAVFRHVENKKWFALVMDVRREKLGLPGDGETIGDGSGTPRTVPNRHMDQLFV